MLYFPEPDHVLLLGKNHCQTSKWLWAACNFFNRSTTVIRPIINACLHRSVEIFSTFIFEFLRSLLDYDKLLLVWVLRINSYLFVFRKNLARTQYAAPIISGICATNWICLSQRYISPNRRLTNGNWILLLNGFELFLRANFLQVLVKLIMFFELRHVSLGMFVTGEIVMGQFWLRSI